MVEPTLVAPSEPEASVRRNDNIIGMVGDHVGQQLFHGQGAGKNPTATAVIQGLTDIQHNVRMLEEIDFTGRIAVDNSLAAHRYYVRTTARLTVAAEKLDRDIWLTHPISVQQMHTLAAELRREDPSLFFAGMRG